MILKFPNKEKSLKESSRTTRAQFKAVVKHSPSLDWKLKKNESPLKSRVEEVHESHKKIYDSDASETSIISQDIQTELLVPLKDSFNLVKSREANRERREKMNTFLVFRTHVHLGR